MCVMGCVHRGPQLMAHLGQKRALGVGGGFGGLLGLGQRESALGDEVFEVVTMPFELGGHRIRLGDVAGRREHAGHFTAFVAVHRRVVEHLGEPPGDVADGERVVPHRAGLEDLRVACLRAPGR